MLMFSFDNVSSASDTLSAVRFWPKPFQVHCGSGKLGQQEIREMRSDSTDRTYV